MLRTILICVILALVATPVRADWVTATVATSTGPECAAVNPVANKIYVTNASDNSVTVIDGATNATVRVPVGLSPAFVGVNPVTNRVYVANRGDNTVTVIDGSTNGTTVVPVGVNPAQLAVNAVTNKVYVANAGSNNVTVIDGATNGTSNVAAGVSPIGIAVNTVTNRIYVANTSSAAVTVIDGATNNTLAVAVGSASFRVAANPTTNQIYVVHRSTNRVTVINGATNDTASIGVGAQPYALCVHPVTNKIYVANYSSNSVTVIDGLTRATNNVPVGVAPCGVEVNPVTNRIYVPCWGSNSVTVVEGATSGTSSVAVGAGPQGAGVNPITNKIYVVNNGDATVSVVDGTVHATATIATGQPGGCDAALNPVTNKIYVANRGGNGSVSVVDGATGTATTLQVGGLPVAVAANPVTNKIYVADQGRDSVIVIDGATNGTTTVAAGLDPMDVAVNVVTNRIYVPNNSSPTVTVIDGATNTAISVPVGGAPRAVAVNQATNRIYVANGGGYVTVIDGATNTTTNVTVGTLPWAVSVNPVTNRIYVANNASNTISVIDGATNSVFAVVLTRAISAVDLAVNAVTNKVYVANRISDNVTVIDGLTHSTVLVPCGASPVSVTVDPIANKVYAANSGSGSVTVIDGATNGRTTIAAGMSPQSVCANAVTGRVYTADLSGSGVAVITPAPNNDTKVRCVIDAVAGTLVSSARPGLTGRAVNRMSPARTRIERVLQRRGTAQLSWPTTVITSGAGTDSAQWSWDWGIDSLAFGENYLCGVAVESDAASTCNHGLGTPMAGNVTTVPVYRMAPDVGCTAVLIPTGTITAGSVIAPEARVKNYGISTVSFDVAMSIGTGYSELARVLGLAPGDSAVVAFPNWVASPTGTRLVRCSTRIAFDGNPANNRSTDSVSVTPAPYPDVGCAEILVPVDSVASFATITPACSVINHGIATLSYAVRMTIGSDYSQAAGVTDHLPGTKRYVTFPSWTAMTAGAHSVTCSTASAGDANPDNDARRGSFIVRVTPAWADTWEEGQPMPAGVGKMIKAGGWLAAGQSLTDAQRYVFAAKGNKTNEFYRYDVLTGLWSPAAPIPLGPEGKLPGKGCKATADNLDNVYMVKGSNTRGFWRYTAAADTWTQLSDVPLGTTNKKVKGGADVAYVERDGQGYVYLLKGYQDEFWRYRISGDSWEPLQAVPVKLPARKTNAGSWLELVEPATDSGAGLLFVHKATIHHMWCFDLAADSWLRTQLTGMPFTGRSGRFKRSKDGGSAAGWNGNIYALKGGGTCEFWRYNPGADSWTELASVPEVDASGKKKRVKAGGDIVGVGGGGFFALKGNGTNGCWRIVVRNEMLTGHDGAMTPGGLATDLPASAHLSIAPNPMRAGSAMLRIAGQALQWPSGPVTVAVYDASGRLVLRQALGIRSGPIAAVLDLRSLRAGAYIVRLTADRFPVQQKLVVW